MIKHSIYTAIFAVLLGQVLFLKQADAQVFGAGVGVDSSGFGSAKFKKKEEPAIDKLVLKIAAHFKENSEKLHTLWYRGYGHLELIKLLLIAQKSNKPFDEIIKLRDTGEKISKIAGKYNLTYSDIYKQTYILKSELDAEPDIKDDPLLKVTTGQLQPGLTDYLKTGKAIYLKTGTTNYTPSPDLLYKSTSPARGEEK